MGRAGMPGPSAGRVKRGQRQGDTPKVGQELGWAPGWALGAGLGCGTHGRSEGGEGSEGSEGSSALTSLGDRVVTPSPARYPKSAAVPVPRFPHRLPQPRGLRVRPRLGSRAISAARRRNPGCPPRSGPSRAPLDFEPRSRPAPGLRPTKSCHPQDKMPQNGVKPPQTAACAARCWSALTSHPSLIMVWGRKKMSNPFFRRFPTQSFAGSGQPARPGFGFGGAAGDEKAKFLLAFAGERGPGWETLPEPCETP